MTTRPLTHLERTVLEIVVADPDPAGTPGWYVKEMSNPTIFAATSEEVMRGLARRGLLVEVSPGYFKPAARG